jgi:carbonic anhydrase/acetyltransferase-like protein (isoleucine patch superfamily)
MGAIVMNGAVIGRNCLIGAVALTSEGSTIPEASLVIGMPGRIRQTLTPDMALRDGPGSSPS